jgi:hypothetical protein
MGGAQGTAIDFVNPSVPSVGLVRLIPICTCLPMNPHGRMFYLDLQWLTIKQPYGKNQNSAVNSIYNPEKSWSGRYSYNW